MSIDVLGGYNVSVLRKQQNDILKEKILKLENIKSVLNIGSAMNSKDKEGQLYKDYFPNADYYTLDVNINDGSKNHFVVDLHNLSRIKKRFDLVLLMNVLEHVKNPFVVANEVSKIIASNGFLFVSSPFFYPIHKDISGNFSDYWRFTDDAYQILFPKLTQIWIERTESVILSVQDRASYWNNENTVSGYCVLFQKKWRKYLEWF